MRVWSETQSSPPWMKTGWAADASLYICFAFVESIIIFFPLFFLAVAHTWYWGSGHHVRGGPVCHEDHPEQRAADSWALSSKHSLEMCVFVFGQVKMLAYFQLSHIRMVRFPFLREDQAAHKPFTHMQICTQFILINPHSSLQVQRLHFPFSWKPNTPSEQKECTAEPVIYTCTW